MPFVTAAGVDVHYVEAGPADARNTAVLLHGFSPDLRLMTGGFEPLFAERTGWRRIYLDLPGMGRTVAPQTLRGTDAVITVVRAAIDALAPGRYAVAGQSYGGHLARALAAAEPDRVTGLALICPVAVAEAADRDVPAHAVLVDDLDAETSDDFTSMAVVRTAETHRRYLAEVAPGLAAADPDALARIREDYAGTVPDRSFARPVLIVVGRQDAVVGHRDQYRWLGLYPRATFAVLDRAGHHAHFEQPAVFDALTRDWLDRVESVES